MYKILMKKSLTPTVVHMRVEAPRVAKNARAGQFVILRPNNDSERIPLTIAGTQGNGVDIIYQIAGATTLELNAKQEGDCINDFLGPLGRATELEDVEKALVIGGGVGCAIAYPIVKALHEKGAVVDSLAGFRSKDMIILAEEFAAASRSFTLLTDDGSAGERGFVTDALRQRLEAGETFDKVFAIGPLPMMRAVCNLTKEYGIPTIVSMNPIMIDGTGMCGGCRLTVGGQMKFACVDGPDFDGHQVDFEEAIARSAMYHGEERHRYEAACNLFKEVE